MSKRYVLFGMASVLAIALVVPAFGGPSNPIASQFASAKKTAKQALKAANAAQTSADNAKSAADNAKSAADNAKTTADKAQTDATAAQTTANQAKTAAAAAQTSADAAQTSATAAQTTADAKFGTQSAVFGDTTPNDSSATKIAFAGCPTGSKVAGGGFGTGGANNEITPTLSSSYISSWLAGAEEIGAGTANNWNLQANVICLAP